MSTRTVQITEGDPNDTFRQPSLAHRRVNLPSIAAHGGDSQDSSDRVHKYWKVFDVNQQW